MKITKTRLREIIKEEIQKLNEASPTPPISTKNSPLGKAIDYATQYRISGDKKWIDKIRKTLSFMAKKDIDDWIKQHIKVNEANKNIVQDLTFLADMLANSMEDTTEQEFVSHVNKETGIDKKELKKIYNAYWKLSANKRYDMRFDWSKWLLDNFKVDV